MPSDLLIRGHKKSQVYTICISNTSSILLYVGYLHKRIHIFHYHMDKHISSITSWYLDISLREFIQISMSAVYCYSGFEVFKISIWIIYAIFIFYQNFVVIWTLIQWNNNVNSGVLISKFILCTEKISFCTFLLPGAVFTNHSLERSLSYSPEFSMYRSIWM